MIILAFAIFSQIPLFIWILGIRPYCIKNGKGYTPGYNVGATIWMDWQSATEVSKKKGDRGMLTCCRIFLGLKILFFVCSALAFLPVFF